MRRCWLKDTEGDALHAEFYAASFNIKWLLRAIARGGVAAPFLALMALRLRSGSMHWAAFNIRSHRLRAADR